MRERGVAFIVYNNIELRLFSNSKLAHDMAYAISGYCEEYESPILLLYRLQELISQHPQWDIQKIRINDMDLTPQVVKCYDNTRIGDNTLQVVGGILVGKVPMYHVTHNIGGNGYVADGR